MLRDNSLVHTIHWIHNTYNGYKENLAKKKKLDILVCYLLPSSRRDGLRD